MRLRISLLILSSFIFVNKIIVNHEKSNSNDITFCCHSLIIFDFYGYTYSASFGVENSIYVFTCKKLFYRNFLFFIIFPWLWKIETQILRKSHCYSSEFSVIITSTTIVFGNKSLRNFLIKRKFVDQ